MSSEKQLSLFSLIPNTSLKEDPKEVIRQLKTKCEDCRLGAVLHPNNKGLVWRGSTHAKIAVISEAPGDKEMDSGLPLVGKSGDMWEKWAEYAGIDTKTGCLITNVVQCQPDKVETKDNDGRMRMSQRAPADDEIQACFGSRCLRILRAMPNLEVVLTLGWVAASTILGVEAKAKTHENRWFGTSILPGVGVYCMVHPSYLVREPTQAKSETVKKGLNQFRNEYLRLGKILPIVRQMEEADPWE